MDSSYKKLAVVISINTVVMFLLTYALIDSWDHFYPNINRVYMALMMVAPMLILMLWVMRSMYENRKLNTILYLGFSHLFVGSFLIERNPGGELILLPSLHWR